MEHELEFTDVCGAYRALVRTRRGFWASVPELAVEMADCVEMCPEGWLVLRSGSRWGTTRVGPNGAYASSACAGDRFAFSAALQLALPVAQCNVDEVVYALRRLDDIEARCAREDGSSACTAYVSGESPDEKAAAIARVRARMAAYEVLRMCTRAPLQRLM